MMQDNQEKMLSELIFEKEFNEVKGMFGLNNIKAYDSREVDKFLSDMGAQAEDLEDKARKMYAKLRESRNLLEAQKKQEKTARKAVRSTDRPESINRMQQHMQELLVMAEEKAEQVTKEAESNADLIILEAKEEAKHILEKAKKESSELSKHYEEKMERLQGVKAEIEGNAKLLKEQFNEKANEVSRMGQKFKEMSENMRQLMNE